MLIIWKFQKHRGPHKMLSLTTCGPRTGCLRLLVQRLVRG